MAADTLIGLVREFLQQRRDDVRADPSLVNSDPLTLSTVWYRLRPKIIELYGGNINNIPRTTRKDLEVKTIRYVCEKELGVRRADLGIYAAARAQFYFGGEVYDLTIDNLVELKKLGVAMLFIEKEGVPKVFVPFSTDVGVSLVNSRGFFTENTDDLSQLVKDELKDQNAGVFHDFDASGVQIWKKSGLPSVGVDPELIEDINKELISEGLEGIDIADVEEEYDGENSVHWKWLKTNYPKYKHLEYLKHKRVEIDSVLAKVGAGRLWKAVQKRLEKISPTMDYYNRALDIKQFAIPPFLKEFDTMVSTLLKRATAYRNRMVRAEYSEIDDGFRSVEEEEQKILNVQLRELENNDTVNEFKTKVERLTRWLKRVNEE
jgi:hypothetical protein